MNITFNEFFSFVSVGWLVVVGILLLLALISLDVALSLSNDKRKDDAQDVSSIQENKKGVLMRQLTTLELKLLFEALVLISLDDGQDEFMQKHGLTQDEFDKLTIDLRCVIDAEINKREFDNINLDDICTSAKN